jgi:hypothetical protein
LAIRPQSISMFSSTISTAISPQPPQAIPNQSSHSYHAVPRPEKIGLGYNLPHQFSGYLEP